MPPSDSPAGDLAVSPASLSTTTTITTPTRRGSFRKSLVDCPWPQHHLDALEEKRRLLDESIHKYIASKEREFKQFERDLRRQLRNGVADERNARSDIRHAAPDRHRTVSDPLPARLNDRANANGHLTREHPDDCALVDDDADRVNVAGLTDSCARGDRDKDFVGVFTPRFLPALSSVALPASSSAALPASSSVAIPAPSSVALPTPSPVASPPTRPKRPSSAPGDLRPPHRSGGLHTRPFRSNSVHSPLKSPPQRISPNTSFASTEGPLLSAMKSSLRQPKHKRVSLAVGDAIVAPSDNLPPAAAVGHPSRSSHSRLPSAPLGPGSPDGEPSSPDSAASFPLPTEPSFVPESDPSTSHIASDGDLSTFHIDPDGDLFDLEREIAFSTPSEPPTSLVDHIEHADTQPTAPTNSVLARAVAHTSNTPPVSSLPSPLAPAPPDLLTPSASASASQQPTHSGFRRPSAHVDPVSRTDESEDDEDDGGVGIGVSVGGCGRASFGVVWPPETPHDVYGSSFHRSATGKGSFGGGGLGQSLMERHLHARANARALEVEMKTGG